MSEITEKNGMSTKNNLQLKKKKQKIVQMIFSFLSVSIIFFIALIASEHYKYIGWS